VKRPATFFRDVQKTYASVAVQSGVWCRARAGTTAALRACSPGGVSGLLAGVVEDLEDLANERLALLGREVSGMDGLLV
jgi:hypothetical protein